MPQPSPARGVIRCVSWHWAWWWPCTRSHSFL